MGNVIFECAGEAVGGSAKGEAAEAALSADVLPRADSSRSRGTRHAYEKV